MKIAPGFIGIDIAKCHLDIFDSTDNTLRRLENTEAAIAGWLARRDTRQSFVVFEATGRYDERLALALGAAGIGFARVNPSRARDFVRSIGRLAKTDAIDARMLAAMGERLAPEPTPPVATERRELTALHKRRDQLIAMRQQEKARSAEAHARERPSIERHLEWLEREIAELEVARDELVRASASLKERHDLLCSIPGIGPVTATTVLALMPELGHCSGKAAAALAGLAPMNRDSGQLRGQRAIRGGRARVRKAFYMAGVTAARQANTKLSAFAAKLKERGKPFKVVIIAVARKLLGVANSILHQGVAYRA